MIRNGFQSYAIPLLEGGAGVGASRKRNDCRVELNALST
jgi:hypothetical protein